MMTFRTYVAPCTLMEKHTIGNCYTFNERYTRKDSKGNNKEDNQKKEGDNHDDKGFQKSRGTVAVIFAGFQTPEANIKKS